MAERLQWVLEVDDKGSPVLKRFRAEVEGVAGSAKKFDTLGRSVEGVTESLGGAARAGGLLSGVLQTQAGRLAVIAGAALTVRAAYRAVTGTIRGVTEAFRQLGEEGSRLQRLSRSLQLPTETLTAFQFASRQAGVEIEHLGLGFKRLSSALVEAGREGTKARRILVDTFGFSENQLRQFRSDPVQAFLALSDAFARYADGARKSTAAQELFGRGFFAVLALMKEGTPQIERNIALARELGLVWSTEQQDAAERLADSIGTLGEAFTGLRNRIINDPALINGLADTFDRLVVRLADFGRNIPQETLDRLRTGLVRIAAAAADVTVAFAELIVSPAVLSSLEKLAALLETVAERVRDFDTAGAGFGLGGGAVTGAALGLLGGPFAPLTVPLGAVAGGATGFLAGGLLGPRSQRAQFGFTPVPEDGFTSATADDLARAAGKELPNFGNEADAAAKKAEAFQEKLATLRLENELLSRGLDDSTIQMELQIAALEGEAREAQVTGVNIRGLVEEQYALKRAQDEAKKAAEFERTTLADLSDQVAVLSGTMTEAEAETRKFVRGLEDVPQAQRDAAEAQFRQVQALEAQKQANEELEDSYFDLFAAIERGGTDVFEALILGTRDVADAFEGLKLSIIRSFAEAFIEGFKQKLGFEAAFKVNIVQFGKNIAGLLSGAIGGNGTSGQGVVGSLLNGVFGQAVPAGTQVLPANFVGPPGPGQAIAAGPSLVSQIAAVVGAAISIALSAKAVIDTSRDLKKQTLGDPSADRLRSAGLVSVGAGAIGGAAAGAAIGSIFPGIGTLIGAALGAAIGALVQQIITQTVAGAVSKGVSEATKRGGSQQQLTEDVTGDALLNVTLAGFPKLHQSVPDAVNTLFAVLNPIGFALNELFLGMIPDIELLFDKFFRDAVENASGVTLNRQLGDFRGQGAGRGAFEAIRGVGPDAQILSRFISALIGAGRDNPERIARFTNILVNSLAQMGKSFEEAERVIFRIFRGLNDNRLTQAFLAARTVFPGVGEKVDGPAAKLESLLVRAFEQQLKPLDVQDLVNALRNVSADLKIAFEQPGRRRSRRAAREAFPALLEDNQTTAQAIGNFARALESSVQQAIEKGLTRALLRTPLADALAPIFNVIRRDITRVIRSGFERGLDRLTEDLVKASQFFEDLFANPGFTEFVDKLLQAERELQDIVFRATVNAAIAAGDMAGAMAAINDRLEPFVQNLRGFQQLGRDIRSRSAFALAGPGFAGQEAQLEGLRDSRLAAEQEVLGTAGVGSIAELVNSDTLKNDLPRALELLNQFADARLAELEAEIALARQQEQFFKGVAKAFEGIRDQVAILRGGPRAQRNLASKFQSEVESLLPTALAGDQEAIARIQELLPQLLSSAQASFAPGSGAFQTILTFVDSVSRQIGTAAEAQQRAAEERRKKAEEDLKSFRDSFLPVVSFFTDLSKEKLSSEFDKIVEALGTQGALYGILSSIARGLGIDVPDPNQPGTGGRESGEENVGGSKGGNGNLPGPVPGGFVEDEIPTAKQHGGHVSALRPYLVGEVGPELFTPRTAGTITPTHQLGGTVTIVLEPGAIVIQDARDPEQTAELVLDKLERLVGSGQGARIIRNVQRAGGSRR